ncbi:MULTISPECIES: hypothetical protein [unclassified Microcoleus]|uniref:hypothetical protein n=1 Tax=unclassified Microcoleus TaxID=2642155 RepID=UPI001DA7DA51|nr:MULTISPECIES: hypothetical protein [unclassified Microcoleus]TAE16539.1 MAG: hypothetical protein EAZ94_01055 [Oscillatoriales cyanobacterium]MCC3410694.1 hypothetical protein [Microcoleus sp. PH2017_02_FOX_O_A]MCC3489126.1 hypothetical protein [Microcoleus sp. PH2017_16_JOR_D_A]MCC3514884.1 hypothetical protein [Microcoleus sp. PH2017_18_LLB_O_A]MCC3532811.1 hypothetical protein [Microcoleus sp. PH2017_25_DOB_D_A]
MTASPQPTPPPPPPTPEPNILGNFASIVGLLGTALFFTGWIYRWSYFYYFQLEVMTLDLPVESFFIVPIQVFLANPWTTLKSLLVLLLTALAIYHILWLFDIVNRKVYAIVNWIVIRFSSSARVTRTPWLYHPLMSWQQFNINRFSSIKLVRSLVNEIIIVSLVLLTLFWSARNQGIVDARRDAGETSTLPAVTLIAKKDNIALGRKPDDVSLRLNSKEFKAIGDIGRFTDLSKRDYTDINNPKEPRVWRLLLERGNWIYLFPDLTTEQQKKQKARPLVIAIQQSQSGDQLLIISPEPSKPSK